MKVLVPYFRLLSLLGWRQLISQNTLFENPLWIKLINLLYTLLILGFILSGYTLQYSYCYRQDGYRPYTDVKNSPSSPCCSSTPSTNILSVISEALGPKESVSSFNDVKSTNGSSILTNSQIYKTTESTFDSFRKRPIRQTGEKEIEAKDEKEEFEESNNKGDSTTSQSSSTTFSIVNDSVNLSRSNDESSDVTTTTTSSTDTTMTKVASSIITIQVKTTTATTITTTKSSIGEERDDDFVTTLDDLDDEDDSNTTLISTSILFTNSSEKQVHSCRGNFFALYFVPNLLHFFAYLSMFHLMRTPESEKLETLMERGFLQTTRTTGWILAHKKLVNSLRSFLWMCLAWFTLSIVIHGLIIASRIGRDDLFIIWPIYFSSPIPNIILIVLTVIGLTFNDLICAAIVTSYTVHAQLNISYIVNLCASIRERRIEFQEFYKRIEESRKFIDYLNNDQALGLSFLQITVGCKLSVGIYALLASSEFNQWSFLTVAIVLLSLFFWLTLFMVPLVQAIRLTSVCSDLKKIGHELRARPFGYQDALQDDLDSLLLYTTNLSMVARVIRIPVKSSCILIIFIVFLVVILMFGQLGLLNV